MTQILVELYDALKAAGVPEDKAQAAAASVIGGTEKNTLATKADLVELRSELKTNTASLRSELKDDIASLRSELKADTVSLRSELKDEIGTVRERLSSVETGLRYVQWSIGTVGFGVFLLVLKSFWPN
jgi:chromosome segregation ATPase